MIAQISGNVSEVLSSSIIVTTQSGLSFEVFVSQRDLEQIKPNKDVSIWTRLEVQSEQPQLYGFTNQESRNLFSQLTSVSGVGAKIAMNILSTSSPDEIKEAILESDPTVFTDAPGIGPKGAQRIILELHNRIGEMDIGKLSQTKKTQDKLETVYQALNQLGYQRSEIRSALKKIDHETSSETMIKSTLKEIGRTNNR